MSSYTQEQGGLVIPPGTRSVFVTFYSSHDCGGGIRPHLHTGEPTVCICRSYKYFPGFCAPYITEFASTPHSDCALVSTAQRQFYLFIPKPLQQWTNCASLKLLSLTFKSNECDHMDLTINDSFPPNLGLGL
jgi:hypothetical protein